MARAVMLDSLIQSPVMTSTGSSGWLAARRAMAWRRSMAEPEQPAMRMGRGVEAGGGVVEGGFMVV
ncbi:hypothetical protein Tdes44962_MAKER09071 [Teratosphaeria destructans]|uniref:Uncharacterized protein n=1 Tax=Teratosphaeria destructans TaxID=418781 RepID=A0A9W7SU76_9PEZI|nr:hypothetical protein Tdes44962_MAKER09071 [Teratosphaeria destructans]